MTALLNIVDCVLTCKLHVGVVASTLGASVIVAACHPEKTKRFYQQIGESQRCCSLDSTTGLEISEMLELYCDQKIHINHALIEEASKSWLYLEEYLGD